VSAEQVDRFPKVAGRCPMGCGETLFLGSGGHVTCSLDRCPRPTAVDELVHLDTEHYVVFDEAGWTLEHPARERIDGTMHGCEMHEALRALDGAPVRHGRYRLTRSQAGALHYAEAVRVGPAADDGGAR
jgi:hypothetical protein